MPIAANLAGKQAVYDHDAEQMQAAFVAALRPVDSTTRRIHVTAPSAELARTESDSYTMIHGDSHRAHADHAPRIHGPLACSPHRSRTCSPTHRRSADMGNVRSDDEYRLQWEFFCPEQFRVMKPGRIVAVHCMDVIRFAGAARPSATPTTTPPTSPRGWRRRVQLPRPHRDRQEPADPSDAHQGRQPPLRDAETQRARLAPPGTECMLIFTQAGGRTTR
jgi:hypothetical protein